MRSEGTKLYFVKRDPRDLYCPSPGLLLKKIYLDSSNISNNSFAIMPRMRKDCPICGKQGLLKLSNHLADFHHLSSKERQAYLMQARTFPLDINTLLK